MIKKVIQVTTDDTGETYEFPGDNNPNLFVVEVRIKRIDKGGTTAIYVDDPVVKILHLEERTLQDAGLTPRPKKEQDTPLVETAEDLILRLLAMCEVYPGE